MTAAISNVYLYNVARDGSEAGELWDGITERHLADWEGEWLPALYNAI